MQKEPMSSEDAGPSAGAAADSALPQDSAGKHAVSVLWSFGKCVGALLPVYLAGYFGFSISLVLLGLLVYMGWKHSRDGKRARLQSAMYFLENEQDVTTTRVFRSKRELPAWVNFPDVEKVEWMNKILQQAWPFIGQYLEKLLVETIAPSIRTASAHLQTLSFTKVDLGDRVVGVKAYTEHDKRQVILDLYISYAGDVEINVEVKKYFCKAGVKGIQLHGKLRVILEPLIGDVPLIGAITMFFIRRPKLDINWTGLTNLLDIPGLNAMSDTMIMDAIASFLVLPNRLTVPLVANLHVAQLRSPLPRGIVRIHLLEAENLAAKDNYMKGVISGKSDPYAVLRVGTQIFTSHHVDNNLNPQWREMYEVIVHEVPGQELELEWYTLKDTQSGQVHLKLEWLSMLPSAERLNEVSSYMTNYKNCTVYGTNNPVWEDAFTFFIQDPRKQDIDIQVKDDDRSLTLGSLSIPLSRLLSSAELSMDQWFQLEKSGPASRIYITAMLRLTTLPRFSLKKLKTSVHNFPHHNPIKHISPANIHSFTSFSSLSEAEVSNLILFNHPTTCPLDPVPSRLLQAISPAVVPALTHIINISLHTAVFPSLFRQSHTYISFILLPDKNRITKRKTSVKKKSLKPEFNERFDFDMSHEEAKQKHLEVSVKNSVSFMSREKELLGKLQIDLSQLDLKAGVSQWYVLNCCSL
uniref:Extended synaptotagmin-like protein 1a n=1 Tax=Cyprinus carpio carpio TaxID=630221 RepID=A0A8C1EUK4_CYPCA